VAAGADDDADASTLLLPVGACTWRRPPYMASAAQRDVTAAVTMATFINDWWIRATRVSSLF